MREKEKFFLSIDSQILSNYPVRFEDDTIFKIIAAEHGIPEQQVEYIVSLFIDDIRLRLMSEQTIKIIKFGMFIPKIFIKNSIRKFRGIKFTASRWFICKINGKHYFKQNKRIY